jgi:starch phosphorylase
MMPTSRSIAYFSMEIGLTSNMPTYSGGLGVLAGDTIRSAADLGLPLLAMTLLHRKGYFAQKIVEGRQTERPEKWNVEDFLKEMPQRVSVTLEGRAVSVRAWEYSVVGISGLVVPVYLLDTDLPENSPWDREITHSLYGGDRHYRLCQEAILGIGGVRMLRALGCSAITRFHMNEGHASLLSLELLSEHAKADGRPVISLDDVAAVRKLCVFTTHTPVPAGHDLFPMDLVERVLGRNDIFAMKEVFCCDGVLNMTYLALNLSHYVNGVAKRHGEVSRRMFARYPIDSITNGVHAATWTAPAMSALFDRHIPDWRKDNFSLRHALDIPKPELWGAHAAAKEELIRRVNNERNSGMDARTFTIGFARRAATYKRADLLLLEPERLLRIFAKAGPFQIVYAGKAHPQDQGGKEVIHKILEIQAAFQGQIKMAYLENYDMDLGRVLVAGADLWLNTPQPPLEASGTSGMKAALNGVPSLSIRDGWWVEGHIEGITGWAIGADEETRTSSDTARDANLLYDKLEEVILPLYYNERDRFIDVMRHAIALNGSFFNTQRMLQQYVVRAYML